MISESKAPSPSAGTPPDQPHIVSLVLQAKKALQQGEQLCTNAHSLSSASAQIAVDVLALDAQVRWMSEAVLDQLMVSVSHGCPWFIPDPRDCLRIACGTSREEHRAETLRARGPSAGTSLMPVRVHATYIPRISHRNGTRSAIREATR